MKRPFRNAFYVENITAGLVRQKRFTLIELLVVIAIIAVLAGMLLPALSQAKIMAGKALCVSNQKQFGTANSLYASGYDDYPVPRYAAVSGTDPKYSNLTAWDSSQANRDHWGNAVSFPGAKAANWDILFHEQFDPKWKYDSDKYVVLTGFETAKYMKVFFCPQGFSGVKNGVEYYRTNSGCHYQTLSWSTGWRDAKRMAKIKKPGKVVYLYDAGGEQYSTSPRTSYGYPPELGFSWLSSYLPGVPWHNRFKESDNANLRNDNWKGRHNRSVNLLLLDGHVENVASEVYKQHFNNFANPRNNPDSFRSIFND